jgi:hypothetical protein
MYKNRSVSSCAVLRNINNFNCKSNTIKNSVVRKSGKCRTLRNLEAELGVERYKNKVLAEEIDLHKSQIKKSFRYDKQLLALQDDFEHLSYSVRRSKVIQDRQKEEIENLREILNSLKKS